MEKTDNSYIAIDLETTGLNPKTERIIEIGAARVEDGTVVQTYSTFVNPERELDARIRELTGICDDDFEGCAGAGYSFAGTSGILRGAAAFGASCYL